MNIKTPFKKYMMSILSLTIGLSFAGLSLGSAGNKEIVEDSIQELDTLNKQAVQQLPELPQSGTVDLKAGVTYQDGAPTFDIFKEHIIPDKTEDIHLDQGYSIQSETQRRTQP